MVNDLEHLVYKERLRELELLGWGREGKTPSVVSSERTGSREHKLKYNK